MAKSIFRDKGIQPDSDMIDSVLKEIRSSWDALVSYVSDSYPGFTQKWKYYGAAWGWSLVLKSKGKTLCYLTPTDGYYHVSIIFNDKGRLLAMGSGLPEPVAQAVDASQNNAKNIPCDFDVTQDSDIDIAKILIAVRAKT